MSSTDEGPPMSGGRDRQPSTAGGGANLERLPDDLTPFIRGVALLARTALRGLSRIRVEGDLDRIPRQGPLIIAANHLSNADGVLVGGWLTPALGRRIHWLGKREMVDWPILGRLARAGSVHGIDRGTADIEAFRLAQRILDDGHVMVIFPEGTRSPTGALQEAKDGLAMLALRTGATILPVGVAGTDRFWPRGRSPRPGGRLTLRVGKPFRLADILPAGIDRRAAKSLATKAIMARIAALLPSRHRGVYADAAAALERGEPHPTAAAQPAPAPAATPTAASPAPAPAATPTATPTITAVPESAAAASGSAPSTAPKRRTRRKPPAAKPERGEPA
jgi:1-acyl-sn-glycerol-3-phosphate acyltransferase